MNSSIRKFMIQFQSRSMSDPRLSDIDFKNKMVLVSTTLNFLDFFSERFFDRQVQESLIYSNNIILNFPLIFGSFQLILSEYYSQYSNYYSSCWQFTEKMSHLHHFPESGRASSKEKIMNDDQIFDVLEKCKKDLEFGTLKNAIQGLVQLFIKNRIIRAREIIPKKMIHPYWQITEIKSRKKIFCGRTSLIYRNSDLIMEIRGNKILTIFGLDFVSVNGARWRTRTFPL